MTLPIPQRSLDDMPCILAPPNRSHGRDVGRLQVRLCLPLETKTGLSIQRLVNRGFQLLSRRQP